MYLSNFMILVYDKTRQLNSLNYIILKHYRKYYINFNRFPPYFKKSQKVIKMIFKIYVDIIINHKLNT